MEATAIAPYDEKFYDTYVDGALRSAQVVLPSVLRLIPAKSVVDFGCGLGSWLKACLENGVETIQGLDGDHVNHAKLLIGREQFQTVDLEHRIRLDQRFDLALCLEVAEHLPTRSAPVLVESLSAAAPVVLFSAAIPGQGGRSHVNEQWPPYWERLFAEQGMRKYDVIRPLIWRDQNVEWWYRQNIYIFAFQELDFDGSLDHFEPEFSLVSNEVMTSIMLQETSRDPNLVAKHRGIRRLFSRFTKRPSF